MRYKQLTCEQSYQIYALLNMGHTQTEIAKVIHRHKGTISRELKRNTGLRGYRPKQAHEYALSRRDHTRVRIRSETWELVNDKIRLDWSPEQISGWLKRRYAIHVSHEWIYQHILADKRSGGNLYRHLRLQKKRRNRYGSYERRGLAAFLFASGVLTLAIWLFDPLAALLQGTSPVLHGSTTLITHALALALTVPAFIICGRWVLRRHPRGYLIASALLVLIASLAPPVIAMTAGQALAGMRFTLGEVIGYIAGFILLGAAAIVLIFILLRNTADTPLGPEAPIEAWQYPPTGRDFPELLRTDVPNTRFSADPVPDSIPQFLGCRINRPVDVRLL